MQLPALKTERAEYGHRISILQARRPNLNEEEQSEAEEEIKKLNRFTTTLSQAIQDFQKQETEAEKLIPLLKQAMAAKLEELRSLEGDPGQIESVAIISDSTC